MAYGVNQNTAYGRRLASDAASQRADFWKKTVLPIAAFATGGAALGATGDGAAAGIGGLPAGMAPGGAAISTAFPSVAAGGSAAGVPWMRIGELGAGLFSNGMASRAQGKANDREFAYRTQADQRAYEMAQAQEAQRQKEWAAQQALLEQQFQAQQEQARLDREEEARQNAIAERYAAANEGRNVAREDQRVPYRQAGQIALRDLVGGLR
jgi:hypothetical protein